jgi:hypothetical protein
LAGLEPRYHGVAIDPDVAADVLYAGNVTTLDRGVGFVAADPQQVR